MVRVCPFFTPEVINSIFHYICLCDCRWPKSMAKTAVVHFTGKGL